jgi:hypothetical protein
MMSNEPMSATQCQQAVFEVALELARQDKRLAEIVSAIQLPGDFELDVELPGTVEIELFSRIHAVKADYLQPSFALLTAAAQLADSDLRVEFAQSELAQRVPEGSEASHRPVGRWRAYLNAFLPFSKEKR